MLRYLFIALLTFLAPLYICAADVVIDTPTTNAQFLHLNGDHNTVTVTTNGSISTSGDYAFGISFSGTSNAAALSNDAAITTSGENAYGTYIVGSANTLALSGAASITTSGDDAHGINIEGESNSVTLSDSAAMTTSGYFADGLAIAGTSNAVTLSGSAAITTLEINGHGINIRGDENAVTLSVSAAITTLGIAARGMYVSGNENAVDLSGSATITTSGSGGSYGLIIVGNSNAVTVSDYAAITTLGDNALGIVLSGTSNIAMLSDSAAITTSGNTALGIAILGTSNAVTLSDSAAITTSGDDASGTFIFGNENAVTLSGSADIDTSGNAAHGMFVVGTANMVTLSDSVAMTTSGVAAHGMFVVGTANMVTLSGSANISTSGDDAHGINIAPTYNFGVLSNEINLSGASAITTSGDDAHGINIEGDSNSVTLSSSANITISGNDAHGIYSSGDNNALYLSGSAAITTSGDEAYGIWIGGNTNAFSLSESAAIHTSGTAVHGIHIDYGTGNSVILLGNVFASGPDSAAINNEGASTNITLGSSARLIGVLRNTDADSSLTVAFEPNLSYEFVTSGNAHWILNDSSGRTTAQNDTMLAGTSLGALEVADELQFERIQHIQKVLQMQGLSERSFWLTPYSANAYRDKTDAQSFGHTTSGYGMNAGLPFGGGFLILNGQKTDTQVAEVNESIVATSVHAGWMSASFPLYDTWKANFKVLVGNNLYTMTRQILVNTDTDSGIRSNSGNTAGWEGVFGFGVSNRLALVPSLALDLKSNIDLVYEQVAGYKDSAAFELKPRQMTQGIYTLSLGLTYQPIPQLQTTLGMGLVSRALLSSNAAYSLLDSQSSFSGGASASTDTVSTLACAYTISENLTLDAMVTGKGAFEANTTNAALAVRFTW